MSHHTETMANSLVTAYARIMEILAEQGVMFHVGINKELMLVPSDSEEDIFIEFPNFIVS